jgi:hypothetical protein
VDVLVKLRSSKNFILVKILNVFHYHFSLFGVLSKHIRYQFVETELYKFEEKNCMGSKVIITFKVGDSKNQRSNLNSKKKHNEYLFYLIGSPCSAFTRIPTVYRVPRQ